MHKKYEKNFLKILKFHPPGLAPVVDYDGAYHIDKDGNAAYSERFNRTFGYYQNRAAVIGDAGWFHILPSGERAYENTYSWCGNYQNGYCAVADFANNYFHIDRQGERIYSENYKYAGDFKDDIAVVQDGRGLYTHINDSGIKLHDRYYYDLDVFHKDFARAKDGQGWCHIDQAGKPIYQYRYAMVEPFYNGYARVEDFHGSLLVINEGGVVERTLRKPTSSLLAALSADLVGYWKTQTIRAAVELNIFEYLPATVAELVAKTKISADNLLKLFSALGELGLVMKQQQTWIAAPKGELLQSSNHSSLANAALHWGNEHYLCWMQLAKALRSGKPVYSAEYGDELFSWLDQDKENLNRYQQAMKSYALHDYETVAAAIDFSKHKKIVDAAGGQGVLLRYITAKHKHLEATLLERAKVVVQLTPTAKFNILPFELFRPWPTTADAIFLTRVLHDWNDQECISILNYAANALTSHGSIYVIEMLLSEDSFNGGMLNLNMLVITGGKERKLSEFNILAGSANLSMVRTTRLSEIATIMELKHNADI